MQQPGDQVGETCGEKACHPEHMRFAQCKLREGSSSPDAEILHCAQNDSQDTAQVRSREACSPNVYRWALGKSSPLVLVCREINDKH